MARIVTYECDECGCEIVVTEAPESALSPIYCCGLEVVEVFSADIGPSGEKKVAPRKVSKKRQPKKATTKKAVPKKRPARGKKSSRKSK